MTFSPPSSLRYDDDCFHSLPYIYLYFFLKPSCTILPRLYSPSGKMKSKEEEGERKKGGEGGRPALNNVLIRWCKNRHWESNLSEQSVTPRNHHAPHFFLPCISFSYFTPSLLLLGREVSQLTARWATLLPTVATGAAPVEDRCWWSGRQVQHEQHGHMAECVSCCWGDDGEEADRPAAPALLRASLPGDSRDPWPVGDVDREPVDLCIDCGCPLNGFSNSTNSRSCEKRKDKEKRVSSLPDDRCRWYYLGSFSSKFISD